MYYIVESKKSFEVAAKDLEEATLKNGFGVLHIHNLGETLRSKGIEFTQECKVFEVCNPGQASKVINADMRMNMALPCRISVYTEHGHTKIGMITPQAILSLLSSDPGIKKVADEVEATTKKIINEAK